MLTKRFNDPTWFEQKKDFAQSLCGTGFARCKEIFSKRSSLIKLVATATDNPLFIFPWKVGGHKILRFDAL